MIRGLYISAFGMQKGIERVDVISNNIANIDTRGFKRDKAVFRSFPAMELYRYEGQPQVSTEFPSYVGTISLGVNLDRIYFDSSEGMLEDTKDPLNFALTDEEPGLINFFTIITPHGLRYTRDGSFFLNSEGFLVTKEGYNVMGENGPIKLENKDFTVNEKGEIFQEGERKDAFNIVSFQPNEVEKVGEGLYSSPLQPRPQNAKVLQGFVEKSNVNPVYEMVELINAFRAYEASQRAVKAMDDTLGLAVNELGKI